MNEDPSKYDEPARQTFNPEAMAQLDALNAQLPEADELTTEAKQLMASAEHWEREAESAERMAAWDREQGVDLSQPGHSVGDVNARTYRRCARTLRLEAETGKAHCMCHLRPLDECPNHQGSNPILENTNR
jgi:hypothetical protein